MQKVIFNGRVVGYVSEEIADNLANRLRVMKASGTIGVGCI
jgi:hypothetical protein